MTCHMRRSSAVALYELLLRAARVGAYLASKSNSTHGVLRYGFCGLCLLDVEDYLQGIAWECGEGQEWAERFVERGVLIYAMHTVASTGAGRCGSPGAGRKPGR